MNLTKVSAVAEIVSSVAILVTLGYLVLEMRQNTVAIQGTIRQAMLAEDREILFKQIDIPAIRIGSFDPSNLTDEEMIQLNVWLVAFARTRESQWLQFQNGVLDEVTWRAYRTPLLQVLSREHIRNWWNGSATLVFDQGFVEHINENLRNIPIEPPLSVPEMIEPLR